MSFVFSLFLVLLQSSLFETSNYTNQSASLSDGIESIVANHNVTNHTIVSLLSINETSEVPQELEESCDNVTISETAVSLWLRQNAPINSWDRPMINSLQPLVVQVRLLMTSFAMIVSYSTIIVSMQWKILFSKCK